MSGLIGVKDFVIYFELFIGKWFVMIGVRILFLNYGRSLLVECRFYIIFDVLICVLYLFSIFLCLFVFGIYVLFYRVRCSWLMGY